jgi:hypothetical protein
LVGRGESSFVTMTRLFTFVGQTFKEYMNCPKCLIDLNCGCESCKIHSPNKPNKMIRTKDEYEKCPGCGLEKHIEEWFAEEGRQYDKRKSTTV